MQGRRVAAWRKRAARSPFPLGVPRNAPHQIIFDTCPGKNVGTQNEDAAPAQARRTLLYDQIAFSFVDRVGQRVGAERRIFRDGCGQVGAVRRRWEK